MESNILNALLPSLPFFMSAAEHLSFTKAAEALCVTQGAVSHRIRQMEEELGFPLFHRLTRRIVLTGEGERLYRIMHGPLWDLENEVRRIRHLGMTGELVVHCPPSLAGVWLLPRLPAFQSRHPGIEVHLRCRNDLADFETESVDLALYYGEEEHPSLHVELFLPEWVLPVCSPVYAAAHKLRRGGPGALAGCCLLHDNAPWPNAQYHSEWQAMAEALGLAGLDVRGGYSFDRSELAALAAEKGMGVALGRKQLVRQALEEGRLVAPFGVEFPARQSYFLAMRKEDVERPRIRAILDWLREVAKDRRAGAPG